MMIFVSVFLSDCLSFLPISVALSKRMRRLFNAWSRKWKRIRRCQRVCAVPALEDVFSWQNKYGNQPGGNAFSINLANLMHCFKITHLLAGKEKDNLWTWSLLMIPSEMDVQRQLSGRCEEPTGWMTFHERRPRAQHKTNALHRAAERLAASTSLTVPAEVHYCRPAAHDWGFAWSPAALSMFPPRHPVHSFLSSWTWVLLLADDQKMCFFLSWFLFFKCKFQTGTMASIYDLVEIIRTKEQAGFVFVVPHWTWWSAS